MRGSREVGTWGVLTTPSCMEKQKSCNVPQDYWFRTYGKAQMYRCQVIIGPLAMRILNGVSLAGRWWPVLVAGYRFHRNTGTNPIPLLKKINKRQNFGPGLPRGNFPYPGKSKLLIPLRSMTKFFVWLCSWYFWAYFLSVFFNLICSWWWCSRKWCMI